MKVKSIQSTELFNHSNLLPIVVLTAVTLLLFVVLVFLAGFLTKLLLMAYFYFNPFDLDLDLPPPEAAVEDDAENWGDNLFQLDPRRLSLWRFDASHFFAGFFLVGIVGAANVVFQIFLGPFAPVRFGGGMIRVGGGGGQDNKFPNLVMLIVVVIGAARTAWALYKTVKAFSRRGLEVVENSILEVG